MKSLEDMSYIPRKGQIRASGLSEKDLLANINEFYPLHFVSNRHRGKGIGGCVLDELLLDFSKSGVAAAYATVVSKEVLPLLERRGFIKLRPLIGCSDAYIKKLA